jgi:hypothetical protein
MKDEIAGHVARMRDKMNAGRIWVGKPEGKIPLEDQDVGGWIILKWIVDKTGWYGLDESG